MHAGHACLTDVAALCVRTQPVTSRCIVPLTANATGWGTVSLQSTRIVEHMGQLRRTIAGVFVDALRGVVAGSNARQDQYVAAGGGGQFACRARGGVEKTAQKAAACETAVDRP